MQLASQSRIEVIEVARAVRQAVASSWNAYVGLAQIIKNARTQVSAAQLALNGVQQEYQAGTRTTLDVLDAQRDLVRGVLHREGGLGAGGAHGGDLVLARSDGEWTEFVFTLPLHRPVSG